MKSVGVNEVDGMTDMDEWECVIECEMDDCGGREGVSGLSLIHI